MVLSKFEDFDWSQNSNLNTSLERPSQQKHTETSLTMTRLTREMALALIPAMAIQPNMCTMIITTDSMMMNAAHKLRPMVRKVTRNTAPTHNYSGRYTPHI